MSSPKVRMAPQPIERRSHAQRTAETRNRIMTAVIESIAEVGFQRTTAAEIARRAGVTWGAVQHHFGDKEGILMAVLEESFKTFADVLGVPPHEEESLKARVALFVGRSWQHFRSSHYRSTFEILLNLPPQIEIPWRQEMLDEWKKIWSRFFPESDPAQRQSIDLMVYAISVFTGMATTAILEGKRTGARSRELAFLEETLVHRIGVGGGSG